MDGVRYPIEGVTYHSADTRGRFCASGAWLWSTLGEALRVAAVDAPTQVYIAADDGDWTYANLNCASESIATSLLDMGLVPGDRAIFQVGTVCEIVLALFGCFKAGVVPVCTLPQYREVEIGQLTRLSGAAAYFVQADFSPSFDLLAFARRMQAEHPQLSRLIVLRGAAGAGEHSLTEMAARYTLESARARTAVIDPQPGDVAMFQLSGGSTGVPKIIPRMHAEYLGSSAAWDVRQRLRANDVALWALPLIHNAGMILMLVPALLRRRKLVIQSRFAVGAFLSAIEKHRVIYTGSIGPIAPSIIDHPDIGRYDLSSLRMLFTLSRAEALEARTGIPSVQMYGITEGMLMGAFPDSPIAVRHGTMGWPAGFGDEVRLLEPGTEREVDVGEPGELCFRGPHTLLGYYNRPELMAESFTSDGFFRTGDLVRCVIVEGQACYVFEGRLKDNINRGGEKFGAEEVESFIVRHPDVNDARVVAMPDQLLGERACAFIIVKTGRSAPTVASLGDFLQGEGLAKFKLPERIEVIEEFPVTRVGKVDKQVMRGLIAEKLAQEIGVGSARVA